MDYLLRCTARLKKKTHILLPPPVPRSSLSHRIGPSSYVHGTETLFHQAGADINLPDDQLGFTALHSAARRGAVQAAAVLLEAGASVSTKTEKDKLGNTPLHLACTHLKPAAAQLLLRHGADETTPNHAGNTPAEDLDITFGQGAQQDSRYSGLVAGVKKTLAAAPAERAWLRRGWLVMSRSRVKRQRRQPPSSRQEQQAPSIGGGDDSRAILSAREGEQGNEGGACNDDVTSRESAGAGGEEEDCVAGEKGGRSMSTVAKVIKRDGVDDVGRARVDMSGGGEGEGEGKLLSSDDRNAARGGGGWGLGGMISRVAGIKEEDIFHKIVLFL